MKAEILAAGDEQGYAPGFVAEDGGMGEAGASPTPNANFGSNWPASPALIPVPES
jgi:hypothetical protein